MGGGGGGTQQGGNEVAKGGDLDNTKCTGLQNLGLNSSELLQNILPFLLFF